MPLPHYFCNVLCSRTMGTLKTSQNWNLSETQIDKPRRRTQRSQPQTAAVNEVTPMNRDEVLDLLRTHKPMLKQRFGVTKLALFGSFARDQATDLSDVDILVHFDGPATSKTYFGVQFYIEDLLDRQVDLVTDKALRAELRPYVEREALNV